MSRARAAAVRTGLSVPLLGWLLLIAAATDAQAATTSFDVLVDTDSNPATGCSVSVPGGAVSGFELRVVIPVNTTTATGTVGALTVRTCSGGVFGAASQFDAGGWPVGVGLGTGSTAVIEAYLPLSLLGSSPSVRLVVVSSAEVIGPVTVSLGGVVAPANIPMLSPLAMVFLAIGLGLLALKYLRPGSGFGVVLLVFLAGGALAWATVAARDGNPADWSVSPIGTDAVGDSPAGADLAAFFARVEGANLELRIDARLAFDAGNQAPVVNAGADQTITLPATAALSGSATDDGLPNPPGAVSRTWSKVSGPGTVTFGNASAASTTASFSQAGVYVLRLTASDGSLQAMDEVQIAVSGGTGGATARVGIQQTGVLLTAIGDFSQLFAVAYDAQGNVLNVPIGWTSSRPEAIAVDGTGKVTAVVANGSSQITAAAGGIQSAPLLAVVTVLPLGNVLLTDAQILGEPFETDPNAEPSFTNTYKVVLTGVSAPAIGSILVNTESKAVAGRVVAVETTAGGDLLVTLGLVPAPELFPNLSMNEVFDLSKAPVSFPPEIAAAYDIVREGDTVTFTPKVPALASYAPLAAAGVPVGTVALGPFACEQSLTGVGPGAPLPIQLSAPPIFSASLNLSLDLVYATGVGLTRFVVKGEPTFKVEVGVGVNAAFEGKIECKCVLLEINIPIGGALSWIAGGVVPLGAGLEASGKVTVSTLGIKATAEAKAQAELGFACVAGNCGLVNTLGNVTTTFEPMLNLPSIGNLRVEPALSAFGTAEFEIGNPFLAALRFDAVKAKAGGKIQGSFAPQATQIADAGYKSDYKVSLEASAGLAADIQSVLSLLGLSGISGLELTISTDLAKSPTGSVTADRATFVTGDTVNFTAKLDPANVNFLGFYNVDRVLFVRNSGGSQPVVGTVTANPGESDFSFAFTAPGAGQASEVFAFVVTKLLPLDILSLEVGNAVPVAGAMPGARSASLSVRAGATVNPILTQQVSAPSNFTTFAPSPLSVQQNAGGAQGRATASQSTSIITGAGGKLQSVPSQASITASQTTTSDDNGFASSTDRFSLSFEVTGSPLPYTVSGNLASSVSGNPVENQAGVRLRLSLAGSPVFTSVSGNTSDFGTGPGNLPLTQAGTLQPGVYLLEAEATTDADSDEDAGETGSSATAASWNFTLTLGSTP